MRVMVPSRRVQAAGRVGPQCIACGNTRRFWIESVSGLQEVDLRDLPEGPVELGSCAKCGSRNSIVVCRVD